MSSRYYSKRQSKKRPKKGPNAPERPKAFKTEASANKWGHDICGPNASGTDGFATRLAGSSGLLDMVRKPNPHDQALASLAVLQADLGAV